MKCKHVPCSRLPRDVQYTAKGSPSTLSSCFTANLTKTRSSIPPAQSNWRFRSSSHTGLNPLFRTLMVRAHTGVEATGSAALPGGGCFVVVEVWGVAKYQSGTCTVTSTKGSTANLSVISRPFASFGLGNCCAEMILTVFKRINTEGMIDRITHRHI